MPNDKITAVGANIAEKAAMIWNVADMLRGPFKPHEYGLVILPMTVVKRFHDCLLPTHQAVLDTYEKVKKLQVIDGFLQKASGYQFYNTSRFTFETLKFCAGHRYPGENLFQKGNRKQRLLFGQEFDRYDLFEKKLPVQLLYNF